jgi:hypothetical protein
MKAEADPLTIPSSERSAGHVTSVAPTHLDQMAAGISVMTADKRWRETARRFGGSRR